MRQGENLQEKKFKISPLPAAVYVMGGILTPMSLRRKILLFGLAIFMVLAAELFLSALGVPLAYRAIIVFVAVGAIGWAAWSEFNRLVLDLSAIRSAIDDTSRGEFTGEIGTARLTETAEISEALRIMRERLAEMGRHLVESLRIESLNILGSILVHDMKNLSFRLHCLSQNILDNYTDPAFRDSLVRTLNDTTDKMDQMVRRFREQKEMVIVKIPVNLNEIVRGAVINLQREAVGIRFNEQYGELPTVWADALLIENAIFNIAENARDAMPAGGWLYVRTQVYDTVNGGGQLAIIDIADTGTGMSEDFIRRDLFAPFVTTKPRGLGLGLYTCRQIIQMHDGKIEVSSRPGRGSVFTIYLPITE